MSQLTRLLDDHSNLVAITQALVDIVSGAEPQPALALAQLDRLSACLGDHLAVEGEMIAAAQAQGMDTFLPLMVHRSEGFSRLVRDWVNYLRTWPGSRVVEDWPGFCRDTLDILRRLVMQIEVENEAVRVISADSAGSRRP